MDSTAGENSPVGRDVGGLLAQLPGVGRPQGFLSQHPTRQPAQGPLAAGFALLPGSLPSCYGTSLSLAESNKPTKDRQHPKEQRGNPGMEGASQMGAS